MVTIIGNITKTDLSIVVLLWYYFINWQDYSKFKLADKIRKDVFACKDHGLNSVKET